MFFKDTEYIITTDDNSFASPQQFPQITNYLRSFSLSSAASLNNSIILIRVHTVGRDVQQLNSFISGLSEINRKYPAIFQKIVLQTINNDIVRYSYSKPSEIINWLLEGHIHTLLGHFHQGFNLQ